jgi:hypothetical protein
MANETDRLIASTASRKAERPLVITVAGVAEGPPKACFGERRHLRENPLRAQNAAHLALLFCHRFHL